jgi:hypothetical protein
MVSSFFFVEVFDQHSSYETLTAAAFTGGTNLDISIDQIRKDFEINTVSVVAVAQQAIRESISSIKPVAPRLILSNHTESFKTLPSSVPKAFIYTGNGLDDPSAFSNTPPGMLTLALGKSATSRIIDVASQAFGSQGQK